MPTTINIAPAVVKVFPGINCFSLTVSGLLDVPSLTAFSLGRLQEASDALRATVTSTEELVRLPIVTQWRDAYRRMGAKASEYRCSFEALARRVIAGKPVATGNAAVDIYNAASLAHRACLGAFDAHRLQEVPIDLRLCAPAVDQFLPLGGDASHFDLRPSTVVYAQGPEILCWCMNHRDSFKTSLTRQTSVAVFVAEGVTTEQEHNARSALHALRDDFRSLGATTSEVVSHASSRHLR